VTGIDVYVTGRIILKRMIGIETEGVVSPDLVSKSGLCVGGNDILSPIKLRLIS
jgi:hypothetical protein